MTPARLLLLLTLACTTAYGQSGPDTADPEETADMEESAPPAVPRPDLPTRNQLALERMQHHYPGQFRSLDDDPGSAALYLPANRSKAFGWVILIPDSSQTADSNHLVEPLRHALADSGWHSLSLQLPEPDFLPLYVSPPPEPADPQEDSGQQTEGTEPDETAQPATTDTGPDLIEPADPLPPDADPSLELPPEPDEQPGNAEAASADARFQHIRQSLDAATAFANSHDNGPLALLGLGEGGWHAAAWQADNEAAVALLLVEAITPANAPLSLDLLTGPLTIPVQDYVLGDRNARAQAAARKNAAKRNAASQYQQVALDQPVASLQATTAVRRIKGWLASFGQKNEKSH